MTNDRFHLLPELSADTETDFGTRMLQGCDVTMATALLADTPIFFGPNSAGRAAVNILANRILAAGAEPRYMTATLTADYDTPPEAVNEAYGALKDAAVQAEMELAAVSCRVLDPGPASGLAVSVSGIGIPVCRLDGGCMKPGDSIIITGPVGALGAAIESRRKGVMPLFRGDGAALTDGVRALLQAVSEVRMMWLPADGLRRGLRVIGRYGKVSVDETKVPVAEDVRTACELAGVDPMDMSCADVLIAVVPGEKCDEALKALRRSVYCSEAAVIGSIVE